MQTFSKAERLCSQVLIERLFEKGKSFNSFPFRVTWMEIAESPAPVKVVISVPKRTFKKAVDRNKIKRQIREVYRKEKHKIYGLLNSKKILLMLIYTGKTKIEFKELELKIIEALERLNKTVNL
ncbi:MAG: ribonuclease P protein component [Bacteroidia bacterium]